jgi:diguanylate cyclase (GGDEF)-like protein/PAS domain S-box-containing protein
MLQMMGCMAAAHDPWLVGLAVAVCAAASLGAITTLARRDATDGKTRTRWLAAAGLCFGLGLWATHFIAMLAFRPPVPVDYNLLETAVSALIAMGGAIIAFAATPSGRRGAWAGGILLGASIGAMHFLGMEAIRFPGHVVIDVTMAALAIAFGMAFSIAALLALARGWRWAAAALLVMAVCTTHFVGMGAATLVLGLAPVRTGAVIAIAPLAVAIAIVTGLVLALGALAAWMDRRLSSRAAIDAARMQQLASATFEGIVIHRNGIILDINDPLARMIGITAAQAKGRSVMEFVTPDYHAAVLGNILHPETTRYEAAVTAIDGTRTPVEILAGPIETDTGLAVVAAVRDLTERKRAESRIHDMALHDALTGLPNRTLMAQRLDAAIADAASTGAQVAVLCLDLDRFKAVNDQFGHHGGDQVLVQVADRLRQCVRAGDTVTRLGGDEFAIVMPLERAGSEIAAALAGRVVSSIGRPFILDNARVSVGTCVGVAIYPADGMVADTLLRNADTALYSAKESGRNSHRFFDATMEQCKANRREMERDLGVAVALGQMEMHYQVLRDCRFGAVIGYEALIRWNHPVRGRVSPGDFIPLAEETGLIDQIGRWAMETACAEAASWAEPLSIAVNLSPVQFRQPDVVAFIESVLARTGLAADRLEIEVTEGVLVEDAAAALAIFKALRALGLRVVLDDFGTGYSSMSYLRQFPFDKIKIDKAFIQGIESDEEAAAIVDAILVLARGLRMRVTAEGVETEAQLSHLRNRECQQVQGFLLGRPIPAAELHVRRAVAAA